LLSLAPLDKQAFHFIGRDNVNRMNTPIAVATPPSPWNKGQILLVIVAALGYFVDVYDLILFGIVRDASLRALGLEGEALTTVGVHLLNLQMVGMLIGGVLWGILGDKKGRRTVLFASIILYSMANLLNAFVHDIYSYGVLRLIAGIGLAGELGVGITLVVETLPKKNRGLGAAIVAGFGVLGAVLAAIIGKHLDWRLCYFLGGVMGLALLGLRVATHESPLFKAMEEQASTSKGAFLALIRDGARLKRYVLCIFVGLPIWFVVGLLGVFSPELAKAIGIGGQVKAADTLMYLYIGLALGDLLSGLISQWLGSRRKVMLLFIAALSVLSAFYLQAAEGMALSSFYTICFVLGLSTGYWAVFITNAAEQFGTNIRATVATSVPNFVRGATVLMTLAFEAMRGSIGAVHAAGIVGIVTVLLALLGVLLLPDSFNRELDYTEEVC
jgi:MFS transporter, putative metabolite:H+ symporter